MITKAILAGNISSPHGLTFTNLHKQRLTQNLRYPKIQAGYVSPFVVPNLLMKLDEPRTVPEFPRPSSWLRRHPVACPCQTCCPPVEDQCGFGIFPVIVHTVHNPRLSGTQQFPIDFRGIFVNFTTSPRIFHVERVGHETENFLVTGDGQVWSQSMSKIDYYSTWILHIDGWFFQAE